MISQPRSAQYIRLACTIWLLLVCLLALRSDQAVAQPDILIDDHGVLELSAVPGIWGKARVRIDFGLPEKPAARQWREGTVFRTLWQTNDIDYTQTVFVAQLRFDQPSTNTPVLLVEIAGANRATEYREAKAGLAVWLDGHRMGLELRSGLVWFREGEKRTVFAALDVPESGVRTAEGTTLTFHGNVPPSLDGSLILKLPLAHLVPPGAEDRLHELEFTRELRSNTRNPGGEAAGCSARFKTPAATGETLGDPK